MSDPTRERILTAFDRELEASPLPPGLRERTVRAAVTSPQHVPSNAPRVLAMIAVLVAVALVATLVLVHLRPAPVPAHSTVPPSPRSQAAVAYDQARGVMIVFGGAGGSDTSAAPLNETWTFDGKSWTQQKPAISPPASVNGAMAYDLPRRDVVLFEQPVFGSNSPGVTWTWNGSTWRQQHPAHTPPIGYQWQGPNMQFDPITRTVLLFGFSPDYQPQTWSWNGFDWTQLHPSGTPAGLGSMVFDGRHVIMLVASPQRVGGRYATEMWQWDGSTWGLLNPTAGLHVPPTASAAYDPGHNRLVLLANDTWTWDGSSWVRQHPSLQPPTDGYMVYLSSIREIISWGSITDTTDGEMYAWNGTDWNLLQQGPHPEATHTWMAADQAAAIVRSTVLNMHPVLLPTSLPGGRWDASVASLGTDAFSITYASDQRDKTITFGAEVANPPPGDATSTDTYLKFRDALALKGQKAGYAEYFVYDASARLSQRWLMWIEPGTSSLTKGAGVWYFLTADGLTDQEFWQVADSLR